jgi:hypothetical protein
MAMGTYNAQPKVGGSVFGSHTSVGVEAAFTFVTFTFPRPVMPTHVTAVTSAGAGVVRVVLDNQRNLDVPWAANTVVKESLGGAFPAPVNALSVGFENISGVATAVAAVFYAA